MIAITELLDSHGMPLACIDDTTYLALHAVYACQDGQPPTPYCCWSDWPTTHIARLFELMRVNGQLAARVAELESLVAAAAPPPVAPRAAENGKIPCDEPGCLDWIKPRGMAAHKRQAHGIDILGIVVGHAPAPALDERHKCPHCNARPKASGLAAHIAREHGVIAVPTPIMERASDLGWRCAEPGCAGAFTRDLHDPAHCTQHAIRSTNGHVSEVAS